MELTRDDALWLRRAKLSNHIKIEYGINSSQSHNQPLTMKLQFWFVAVGQDWNMETHTWLLCCQFISNLMFSAIVCNCNSFQFCFNIFFSFVGKPKRTNRRVSTSFVSSSKCKLHWAGRYFHPHLCNQLWLNNKRRSHSGAAAAAVI